MNHIIACSILVAINVLILAVNLGFSVKLYTEFFKERVKSK